MCATPIILSQSFVFRFVAAVACCCFRCCSRILLLFFFRGWIEGLEEGLIGFFFLPSSFLSLLSFRLCRGTHFLESKEERENGVLRSCLLLFYFLLPSSVAFFPSLCFVYDRGALSRLWSKLLMLLSVAHQRRAVHGLCFLAFSSLSLPFRPGCYYYHTTIRDVSLTESNRFFLSLCVSVWRSLGAYQKPKRRPFKRRDGFFLRVCTHFTLCNVHWLFSDRLRGRFTFVSRV